MTGVNQEFQGPIEGGVAGRDIINNHHTNGRLLTKVERVELHRLVQQLENEFGEPGWQTWKFLHRTIGVENIEVMCLGHRDQAETILQLLLKRATLQEEVENKTEELQQSAAAITNLAERNGELATQLKQAQQAYAALHAKVAALKQPDSCPRCKAATEVIAAGRRRMLFASIAAGVAFVAAAFFAYRAYAKPETVCPFNGEPYAVGSILDYRDMPDVQCVDPGNGSPPQWKAVKTTATKKPLQQRH